MKTITLFFGLLSIPVLSLCQSSASYTVRHKALPIHDKPDGNILVKVPKNKTLILSSYDPLCDCFAAKYLDYQGVLNSGVWFKDFNSKAKGNPTDTLDENIRRLLMEYTLSNDNKPDGVFTVEKSDPASEPDMNRTADLVSKWGYLEGKRIAEGKIWLGMSIDMTLESWGIPYRVNRNNGNWVVREQWIYSDAYLYFENGILTEIYRLNHDEK